jgi:hypothetical protein
MDGNTFDDPTEVATWSELDDGGRSDVTLIDSATNGLQNFFEATVQLVVMARACGHDSLAGFERRDPTSWKRDIAELTGVGR